MATNHDSVESSVGNCTKESFMVGERNFLEVCSVAVWAAQVGARNEMEFFFIVAACRGLMVSLL